MWTMWPPPTRGGSTWKKTLDILQLVTKLAYQSGLIYTGEPKLSHQRFAI